MGSVGALLGVLSEADPTRRLLHGAGIALLLMVTLFRRTSLSPFARTIVPAWLFADIALRNAIVGPGRPRVGLTPGWIALAVLYAFAFAWSIRTTDASSERGH